MVMTKNTKLNDLKNLWESKKNTDTPDIIVPPELMEPSVPTPDITELGRAVKRKLGKAS